VTRRTAIGSTGERSRCPVDARTLTSPLLLHVSFSPDDSLWRRNTANWTDRAKRG